MLNQSKKRGSRIVSKVTIIFKESLYERLKHKFLMRFSVKYYRERVYLEGMAKAMAAKTDADILECLNNAKNRT